MTPVISPWVFYFMSVADSLGEAAFAAAILFGIAWGGLTLYKIVVMLDGDYDEEEQVTAKLIKPLGIVFAIALIITIFAPSSSTITKMLVAQNVTYERVEAAGDVVQEVYEDIMELFEDEGE